MDIQYAFGKFDDAVYYLGTSPETIQGRVVWAFMEHLLSVSAHIPDPLREKYQSIRDRLTQEGKLTDAIPGLSEEEAIEIAALIFHIRTALELELAAKKQS